MAILKGNILTFQIAEVAQALSENLPDWRVVDDANRCYLMRARSEWPRGHAAQRRYEFSATKVECHVTLPMGGYAHATKEMIPPFRRAVRVYFNAVASRRQAPLGRGRQARWTQAQHGGSLIRSFTAARRVAHVSTERALFRCAERKCFLARAASVDQYSEKPPEHLASTVAEAMRRSVVTRNYPPNNSRGYLAIGPEAFLSMATVLP
jgi:hypothetical protein